MVIQINISNRAVYTFLLIIGLILLGTGVYAYGTSNPSQIGHSIGEIFGPTSCDTIDTDVNGLMSCGSDAVNDGVYDLATMKTAVSNDFHNLGGTDANTQLSKSTVQEWANEIDDYEANTDYCAGGSCAGGAVSIYNQAGAGEGGVVRLKGNNDINMHLQSYNGVFRLVNSGWTSQLFSVDQSGNVNTLGSLTTGDGKGACSVSSTDQGCGYDCFGSHPKITIDCGTGGSITFMGDNECTCISGY